MARFPGLWLSSPPLPIEKPPPFGLPGTLWLPAPAPKTTGGCTELNGAGLAPPNANEGDAPAVGVPNVNELADGRPNGVEGAAVD